MTEQKLGLSLKLDGDQTTDIVRMSIELEGDEIVVIITEPDSGYTEEFRKPISIDEHPEFNDMIGDKIYSYVSMWLEERDEKKS